MGEDDGVVKRESGSAAGKWNYRLWNGKEKILMHDLLLKYVSEMAWAKMTSQRRENREGLQENGTTVC